MLSQILGQDVQELPIGACLAHPLQQRLVGSREIVPLGCRRPGHQLGDHPAHQPDFAEGFLIQQQLFATCARPDDIESFLQTPVLASIPKYRH